MARETNARAWIEEAAEESTRRGVPTHSQENLARAFVHSTRRAGFVIVVANQMQEPVHEKEIQLQREADVDTCGLPRGGIRRDDHLAKQPRRPGPSHIESQHVSRASDPEVALVKSPYFTIADHGDVKVAIPASQHGERALRDGTETRR